VYNRSEWAINSSFCFFSCPASTCLPIVHPTGMSFSLKCIVSASIRGSMQHMCYSQVKNVHWCVSSFMHKLKLFTLNGEFAPFAICLLVKSLLSMTSQDLEALLRILPLCWIIDTNLHLKPYLWSSDNHWQCYINSWCRPSSLVSPLMDFHLDLHLFVIFCFE